MRTHGYYNKAAYERDRGELLWELAELYRGPFFVDLEDMARLHSLTEAEQVAILAMAD